MFLNDDLAINHEKYVTRITEVREFSKFGRTKGNWFDKLVMWMFNIPREIEYLYECIVKIENNILMKGDYVSVNNIDMHVTNTDEFSNTVWCVSLDWNSQNLEKVNFEGKYIILKEDLCND